MLLRRTTYYLSSIFTLLVGFKNPIQIIGIFLSATLKETMVVTLKKNGLQFSVRGKMDVWSLKETFLDQFYSKYGFEVRDGWNVVDIGGGIGDYSLYAAVNRPNTQVLAYEPFAESYQLLLSNVGMNKVSNVSTFPQAVSSREGMLQFISPSNDPLSIQTTVNSSLASVSTSVESVSLASILANLSRPRVDLLKLDCEGAEYDILMNSDPSVFERIDRIVMEVHDRITPFNHEDLAGYLTKQGYRVEYWQNAVHESIGYLRASRLREL